MAEPKIWIENFRSVFNPLVLPKSCDLQDWEFLHNADEAEDNYDFTFLNPARRPHKHPAATENNVSTNMRQNSRTPQTSLGGFR